MTPRTASWVLIALLSSSAAAADTRLPPQPTDAELRNDGSAIQVELLRRRYGLRVDDERITMGDAFINRFGGGSTNPDPLTNFLKPSPAATAKLAPSWKRIVWGAAPLAISAVGMLWTLLVVAPVGLGIAGANLWYAFTNGLYELGEAYYAGITIMVLAMLIAATPIIPVLVGGYLGRWWIRGQIQADEAAAAEVYNRELQERIARNRVEEPAAPAPAAASSAPDQASGNSPSMER